MVHTATSLSEIFLLSCSSFRDPRITLKISVAANEHLKQLRNSAIFRNENSDNLSGLICEETAMAIIGFIVVGDRTSHGGTVISGDMTCTIDGQPVSRIGDKVYCPRCMKSTVIVSSRFPTVSALGQNLAYDQDATSCGALIYSRHNGHAGWNADGDNRAVPADVEAVGAEVQLNKAMRFQDHFFYHLQSIYFYPAADPS